METLTQQASRSRWVVPTQHNNQEKVVTIASALRKQIVAIRVAPREPIAALVPSMLLRKGRGFFYCERSQ
jgi:hypothetical protein